MQQNRDLTKYIFNNVEYGKGRLVLEIVRAFLFKNPNITFLELIEIFPPEFQGSIGVLEKLSYAKNIYKKHNKKRYHIDKGEVLKTIDGVELVVSREWNIRNIQNILNWAKTNNFSVNIKK